MDILAYIQSLMNKRNYRVEPIKLLARDKTDTQTTIVPDTKEETYAPNKEGLINAFPKQMNWLNWQNRGFKNALLDSQIWTESRGNPNAISHAGATGIAQFMPGTWEGAIKRGWVSKDAKRTDPQASLVAQEKYMDLLYSRPEMKSSKTEEDRYAKTLAAYNAGYGNLRKAIEKEKDQGGYWLDYMSNETKKYVPEILGKAEEDYFKNKEDYVSKYQRG